MLLIMILIMKNVMIPLLPGIVMTVVPVLSQVR